MPPMPDARRTDSFQWYAAWAAIASAPLALASLILPLAAVDFDLAAFTNPAMFLGSGGRGARLLKAGLVLDMLGYYLLLGPALLVLGRWAWGRGGEWARLSLGCLFVYVFVGACGAAALAGVLPRLVASYPATLADQRPVLEALYLGAMDAVYGGLWNILEVLLGGVGWLVLGALFRRERRWLGTGTMLLGAACLADAAGNVLAWSWLAEPGLYVYLVLAPAWALVMGLDMLKRQVPH
jgi:hypothetical protein